MAKDPAYIRSFKALTRATPSVADLPLIEGELYGANDRATAVMLGSVLEAALESFLKRKTRGALNADDTRILYEYRGPLGDFSGKTLIGYAFNLFGPETKNDLELIRIMRNGFAHSRVHFDFENNDVSSICTQLKSPDWSGAFIPKSYLEAVNHDELKNAIDKTHPRTRYICACHVVAERLLSYGFPLPAYPYELP